MTQPNSPRKRYFRLRGNTIEVFGRAIKLPASRLARVALGVAFVIGGIFSFLPVLGLWMLPVGLIILSIDFAIVRRWRRRSTIWWERRRERREAQARQGAQMPVPTPARSVPPSSVPASPPVSPAPGPLPERPRDPA